MHMPKKSATYTRTKSLQISTKSSRMLRRVGGHATCRSQVAVMGGVFARRARTVLFFFFFFFFTLPHPCLFLPPPPPHQTICPQEKG